MDYEDFVKRKQLCIECDSGTCIFNPDGVCMAPFVTGHSPRVHDDGCFDFRYREEEGNGQGGGAE